jgi:hypothetical protein
MLKLYLIRFSSLIAALPARLNLNPASNYKILSMIRTCRIQQFRALVRARVYIRAPTSGKFFFAFQTRALCVNNLNVLAGSRFN